MSEAFVAEIRIFPYNFAPHGWAFCNGQLLSISQNTALFSLIGTYYGGNGTSNFGLPNLQGSIVLNQGQGPGLSNRVLGEIGGENSVTLTVAQIAAHNHLPNAKLTSNTADPLGLIWGNPATVRPAPKFFASTIGTGLVQMDVGAIALAGGGQPHNNLMPYLALNFCIALQGIYPSRN